MRLFEKLLSKMPENLYLDVSGTFFTLVIVQYELMVEVLNIHFFNKFYKFEFFWKHFKNLLRII